MKKSMTIAIALVAFGSSSAFAASHVVAHKSTRIMKSTKVVNDENQGRVYVGGNVDYTFRARKNSSDVLDSKHSKRFNFGAHIGYKQPIADKFFIAAEFGPHWSTLNLVNAGGFGVDLKEKWGADLLAKPGYNVTDKIAVEGIVGYRYSRFERSTNKESLNGHALVAGAGAEYMVIDSLGLGANYKHNFWFNEPAKSLGNDTVGVEINYYF